MPKIDDFTLAYIEAALWSTSAEIGLCDACHEEIISHKDTRICPKCGGNVGGYDASFQGRGRDISDLAPETLERMVADCGKFQADAASLLESATLIRVPGECSIVELAAHDFWLTRCGHGSGFWDGDWPEPQASELTRISKAFGEVDLYLGDDGRIYS